MAEFYVLKRETCPECKGSKYLEHPLWNAYGEWRISLEKEIPSESQERLWWEEQGFWGNERPPEEYECGNCAGRGYVDQCVAWYRAGVVEWRSDVLARLRESREREAMAMSMLRERNAQG